MSRILITGSSKGLGREMVKALGAAGHDVIEFDLDHGHDVCKPDPNLIAGLIGLDVLINNAGVNVINWLEKFTEADWDRVMDTNAKGIFKMSQACLPLLIESKGTILNIVSNAAHMPMTCSLAYNASKGAAHIMTKQLARELTRLHDITVFGIAPNKLAGTEMSKSIDHQVIETRNWTMEETIEYQLAGLLAKEETPPELVAEFIAFLLQDKRHHKHLTGSIIPYGI